MLHVPHLRQQPRAPKFVVMLRPISQFNKISMNTIEKDRNKKEIHCKNDHRPGAGLHRRVGDATP